MEPSDGDTDTRLVDAVRGGSVLELEPGAAPIQASVIRDILLLRLVDRPDPRGIQLVGARIEGVLDLAYVRSDLPLHLIDCELNDVVLLQHARLASLSLSGSRMTVASGPVLVGDGVRVDGGMFFDDGFRATGTGDRGVICLLGAHIGGQLSMVGATVGNESGPALVADRLTVDGAMLMRGHRASGTGGDGAIRLTGAHIGGELSMRDAEVTNPSGPAFVAEGIEVDGDLLLTGSLTGHVPTRGAVRLLGARVGGRFSMRGAVVRNESGPAVHADRIQIGATMFLTDGFSATGSGESGAVRLIGARIGGQLSMRGGAVSNEQGPALTADVIRVDGGMALTGGFRARGAGDKGAVRLIGGYVGGQLSLRGATVRNPSGPALRADRLEVGEGMALDGKFRTVGADATDDGAAGTGEISLTHTRLGGRLQVDTAAASVWRVDGLVYNGMPAGPSVSQWLTLLREAMPTYVAQPYQHLAAMARAQGHDKDVRQILIAQREDQLRRGGARPFSATVWAHVTRLFLGYGYKPWRALLGLAWTVVLAVSLMIVAGDNDGIEQVADDQRTECQVIDRVATGLDTALPIVDLAPEHPCVPTGSALGQTTQVFGWVLQAMGWGFATLFVAGFTRAVRQT